MKTKWKLPDYSNCIVNLANSVLSEFGCNKEGRQTLKTADLHLAKGYENIVVILLDGMGKCIVERNL